MTEAYDAAVIDIMLPRLDGLSLIEESFGGKRLRPGLSSYERQGTRWMIGSRAFKQGAIDYWIKPFAFAELLAEYRR